MAAVGLAIFVLGAMVGLLAGSKELQEQVRHKSKQLFNPE